MMVIMIMMITASLSKYIFATCSYYVVIASRNVKFHVITIWLSPQVLNELATQEARSKSVQSHGHGQSQSPGRPLGQVPPSGPVPGKPHGFSPNGSAGLHHGAGSQPGQVSSDCSVPQEYMSASPMNQGHVNQSPMCVSGRGPGERPAPQGSSSHQSSDSGSSRRREGRRENSRTRHVSGGDSRRSASASRYNSYSSDEEGKFCSMFFIFKDERDNRVFLMRKTNQWWYCFPLWIMWTLFHGVIQ